MNPEDRRKMIVRAVLPLIIEQGASVTTSQIARAAGIGEGTIFRAFTDKDELLDACTLEALKPDDALDAIAEIPLDQSLEKRLTDAADTLNAHLQRMGALIAAMHAAGRTRHRDPEQRDPEQRAKPYKGGRRESIAAMRGAMTELFEPEKDQLRLPAEQLASLFLTLLFTRSRMAPDEDGPEASELVDVFLHGALVAR
jgi:AcrR family transcriptional regulator